MSITRCVVGFSKVALKKIQGRRNVGETILVTGGAGFIGRAVAGELLKRGRRGRVLDSLIEQVHGDRGLPDQLGTDIEFVRGDVRNGDVVAKALTGVDSVVHL